MTKQQMKQHPEANVPACMVYATQLFPGMSRSSTAEIELWEEQFSVRPLAMCKRALDRCRLEEPGQFISLFAFTKAYRAVEAETLPDRAAKTREMRERYEQERRRTEEQRAHTFARLAELSPEELARVREKALLLVPEVLRARLADRNVLTHRGLAAFAWEVLRREGRVT